MSTLEIKKYVDDEIDHKERDIDKIKTKPNMYISYLDIRGPLHLSKEVVNNMIDECINPNSPGNEIDIYLDEVENRLTVSDNGRGIPFDKMELICTTLQSGSKFTRESSGGSAGENGVGMTAVNALSSEFEITVRREAKKAIIKFRDGEKTQDVNPKPITSDKHGTTFTFIPSAEIFTDDKGRIDTQGLVTWIDKISHLMDPSLRMTLSVNRKGKESAINKKYRNKNGLYDLVKKMAKKPVFDPIHVMNKKDMPAFNKKGMDNRFMGVELAFTYNETPHDMEIESFCNFVNTIDHGVHVDATRTAFIHFFGKYAREALTEREAKTIEITPADITSGLVSSVSISTNIPPQFASQTKEKMSSSELFKPVRDTVYEALREAFRTNPTGLKRIIDYIKRNAKARTDAMKARNSVIKGETTTLGAHQIKGYTPANNTGKYDFRELFLIEGDGAAGSAKLGRFDPNAQALFALRGVPLNSFGLQLAKVLSNEEFKNLTQILGCNIGQKFDIDKLFFERIILMTDSDVDGYRIASLLCVFFIVHLPELVKAGKIYKAVAPLYKIKGQGRNAKDEFVLSKKQFIKIFESRIGNKIRLVDPATKTVLKSAELEEFLMNNRNYLDELVRIASYYGVDRDIIEFMVIHMNDKDFTKKLSLKYPEMILDDDNILSGIHNGRFQNIAIDKFFAKRTETIKNLIQNINGGKVYYLVNENTNSGTIEHGLKTIGDFMEICQKFRPNIITRFKGLGELNPADIKNTTLNPANRFLIKLTMDDLEEELEKFRVLHGDSSAERKDLMHHFKIDREDLDN